MCKAITNKGTQCSRQAIVDGYCTQHADENKVKYQDLIDDDFDALIQRICRKPGKLSDEDNTIIKNFALNTKLTAIPIEYSRHFCHNPKYYANLVQTTNNTMNALNIIKDEICTRPNARRTVDDIEYYKCIAELTKVFILIIVKMSYYPNKTLKILECRATLESLSKAIEQKEKEYAEEQLNILRTKEVGTQEVLSNDVFRHIFTGYL